MDQPLDRPPKVLFLDDDLARGQAFTAAYPEAAWVRTAGECIDRLAETWDEIHLDHDLEGEVFVDSEREDCGMAVVRWLCEQTRADLKATRFVIHTHNLSAACLMALQLEAAGYDVGIRPFGEELIRTAPTGPIRSLAARVIHWLRGGDARMVPTRLPARTGSADGAGAGLPDSGEL